MDKILINDLVARGIIGVNDWEREQEQEVVINLALFTSTRQAGLSDDIRDCVNYQTVSDKVLAHTEAARRFTVEALAEDVAAIALEDSRVYMVRVRIEKPGAVRACRSVGVEIERERGESV